MFRRRDATLQVFLVHPGGPFWKNKDAGSWSIPKGEYGEGEDPLDAAKREFCEETGFEANGEFIPLGRMKQSSGKAIIAWALEGDCLPAAIRSNTFSVEWPPKSDNSRNSRKLTAPVGSPWMMPGRELSKGSWVFWTAWRSESDRRGTDLVRRKLLPWMIFPLRVALKLRSIEIHVAQISGTVALGLIIEVR